VSSPPLQLRFLLSADALDRLPDTRAEVALVGRSNVGKSSLVNALANSKAAAKVSKTPGRTRLLNCFEVDGRDATLVDAPGYGYASAPKTLRASWQKLAEDYLLGRDELAMVLVLVDGEIGPTKLDVEMLAWARHHTLPHTVVATKHDKVKASQRDKRKRQLAEGCDLAVSDVVWTSASKGVGVDRLRDLVRLWLGLGARSL
jgi:GTP-binding protein